MNKTRASFILLRKSATRRLLSLSRPAYVLLAGVPATAQNADSSRESCHAMLPTYFLSSSLSAGR
jgi:hypothetical protein